MLPVGLDRPAGATVGIGLAGARGWMQWPSFFEGKLLTNAGKAEFVPIPRFYGFIWLFVAGVPWAGLGACLLAWCGPRREVRVWHWVIRIAFGLGCAYLARRLFFACPRFFLPMYDVYNERYHDLTANPNLRRLRNDCDAAINPSWRSPTLGFLLPRAGSSAENGRTWC